jgi:hypothetical protein
VAAPRPWFDRPTTLERDIMGMSALGYSDQQIAQEVLLSKVAVRLRMLRLAKRWRFQEIRQLYVLAGQLGWARIASAANRPRRHWQAIAEIHGRATAGTRHPWRKTS